jgi:hypothetical protein
MWKTRGVAGNEPGIAFRVGDGSYFGDIGILDNCCAVLCDLGPSSSAEISWFGSWILVQCLSVE